MKLILTELSREMSFKGFWTFPRALCLTWSLVLVAHCEACGNGVWTAWRLGRTATKHHAV